MVPRKYQKTVAKSIAEKISVASAYDVMEIISAIFEGPVITISSGKLYFMWVERKMAPEWRNMQGEPSPTISVGDPA
jgi:hypothetical protein